MGEFVRKSNWKRQKTDDSIAEESEILVNFITSTKFCKQVRSVYDTKLIESTTAKKVIPWCVEYFDEHETATKENFKPLFEHKKKKEKIDPIIIGDLEGYFDDKGNWQKGILEKLSEQFAKQQDPEENIDFHIGRTKRYFEKRHLILHLQQVQNLVDDGDHTSANKLIKEFKPIETGGMYHIADYICNVQEMRSKERVKPKLLMKPWLSEGQATFIHADCGVGKSLFVMHIAYLLGISRCNYNEDYDYNIDKWEVETPTGCLYVDGELGESELEDRMGKFEYLGEQDKEFTMQFWCIPEYQIKSEVVAKLSDRAFQLEIISWLKEHPNYKLIILDSVTTLFGLENENDNSEFSNKVNPFLRDLRALNVACLLLHHSGKDQGRGLRGASSMGAMVHNIFNLVNLNDRSTIDEGEARFSVDKGKQRGGGFFFKRFDIHYFQDSDHTQTEWETPTNRGNKNGLTDERIRVIERLLLGETLRMIEHVTGIKRGKVGYIRNWGKENGYITGDKHLLSTEKWNQSIEKDLDIEDN